MPQLMGFLLAALIVYIIVVYNRLVKTRNMVKEAWSGIEVQLKRRSNLVPNLVETVRGYSAYEQSILEEIVRKRTLALQAQGAIDKGAAENDLSGSIKTIFALAEAYPDLKASANYLALQEQLIQVEDQIQLARRYYNGAVRMLNTKVESFPDNLIAKLFGFTPADFFTLQLATEAEAPTIRWEG